MSIDIQQQQHQQQEEEDKKKKKKPAIRKSDRKTRGQQQHSNDNNDKKMAASTTTNNKTTTSTSTTTTTVRPVTDGIGSLNPVYILASQKLNLPLHAAEGVYTCLVDHTGKLVTESTDDIVNDEFNTILDMATKCCEGGKYDWLVSSVNEDEEEGVKSSSMKKKRVGRRKAAADDITIEEEEEAISRPSPNSVSDDTANTALLSSKKKEDETTIIDPSTDFGTIFEECKKQYHKTMKEKKKKEKVSAASSMTPFNTKTTNEEEEEEVHNNLFNWHVANLEMSSGAPMSKLGQKWNEDESFGYGGDHSYLEGGMRNVIESLSVGFDVRGVGCDGIDNTSNNGVGNGLRRSGDFASLFSKPSSDVNYTDPLMGGGMNTTSSTSRGIIQCGIEVVGITIVERDEVKQLRKRKRPPSSIKTDEESVSLRRSHRENRGVKLASFMEELSPKSKTKAEEQTEEKKQPPTMDDTSLPSSTYGNEKSTVVHVTTKCGLTLEADAVIVTTPLAILSIPKGEKGHISFDPPLPTYKQNALNRLGVGAYNKCCMSFEKPFWNNLPRHLSSSSSSKTTKMPGNWNDEMTQRFDFIGHASAEHGKDILFLNLKNAPILVAIYGGSDYSKQVEGMHDEQVVFECMKVLHKLCSNAMKANDDTTRTRRQLDLEVPDWPIDYFVSRWGSDPYSRGAFSYVPPGVNGFEELTAMSRPVHDYRPEWEDDIEEVGSKRKNKKPKRPLIMFAGEATTPYHPSTMHGAFETGIREAYRLDLALEPSMNGLEFDESVLYQPTFSLRRDQTELDFASSTTATASKKQPSSSHSAATYSDRFGRVSLEAAAATGCKKCAKELATGEKRKDCHSDQCPRKMFGSALERAVSLPPPPAQPAIKPIQQAKLPSKTAPESSTPNDTQGPQKPPNLVLLPGMNNISAPAPEIGTGWTQEVVRRTKKGSTSKSDRFYISPQGKRIRSWAEVLSHVSKVGSNSSGGGKSAAGSSSMIDITSESWWFDHDASILRGVESFGASTKTMSMIKKKVLAPAAATRSPKEMVDRYKFLMGLVGHTDNADTATLDVQDKWKLPGQRGRSWLAAGVDQKRKYTMSNGQQVAKKVKKEATDQAAQSTVGRRSSRRRS